MTTRYQQVRNPEDGSVSWLWQVFAGRSLVGGGYCATKLDARKVAGNLLRSLILA